jgi:hypothetical protein
VREGNQERGAETVREQSVLKRVKRGKNSEKNGKKDRFCGNIRIPGSAKGGVSWMW